MRPWIPLLALAITLPATFTLADEPGHEEDGVQLVQVRYHAMDGDLYRASVDFRFRTPSDNEVGWRLSLGEYHQQDAAVRDRQLTFGPVWAGRLRFAGGRVRVRVGFEPWATVWTERRATREDAEFTVRFGADSHVMLQTALHPSGTLRLSPGVGIVFRHVRAKNSAATPETIWDHKAAWRLVLPVWLGEKRRFKIEGGYSFPTSTASLLADERLDVALAWVF